MGTLIDKLGPNCFSWFILSTTLGLWVLYGAILWVGREGGRGRRREGGEGKGTDGVGGRRQGERWGGKEGGLEVEEGRTVTSA
jgi:hypothetical protein